MVSFSLNAITLLIVGVFFLGDGASTFAFTDRPGDRADLLSSAGDKFVRTELYFGLSRRGRPDVEDEEFQRFIDEYVTPRFPDGLTVLDAQGQWREGGSTVIKERSKVLIIVYPRKNRKIAGPRIEEIRSEYKKRFAQSSVMRIDMGKSLGVSF